MGPDVLDDVTERACGLRPPARPRPSALPDILFAVLDVYGKLFDRVLYLRGTSREELAERLVGAGAARGQG